MTLAIVAAVVTVARSHRRWLVTIPAVVSLLMGCEQSSPFAVSRARHPEYYDTVPGTAPDDAVQLPGEAVEIAMVATDRPGSRLDLRHALLSGGVEIDHNDPSLAGRLGPLFDGDTTTLARSDDVNPLILVLRLSTPVRLVGVRLFPSYSTYDWTVRPEAQGSRWMVQDASDGEWSRLDLPAPVSTTEVRLEVRRLEGDNYVHVNEVELLTAP